ncbi:metallopeptidase TldD-related protein [Kaarinaea lacus]
MHNYFHELSAKLFALLKSNEVLLTVCEGEESDFVRLNQNKIRQAGSVKQQAMQLTLISTNKQSGARFQLRGNLQADFEHAKYCLQQLREQLPLLPEDPYLNYSIQPQNSTYMTENRLPEADQCVEDVLEAAAGLDLVGIWSSGAMISGFSNSLGQFNWHSDANFNFDWSVYLKDDKAIKQNYAGFEWNKETLHQKLDYAKQTLTLLERPAKTVDPGRYRVFLSPSAMYEITGLLGWGGFGLKSHRTAQTPLLKMARDGATLSPKVSLVENHVDGLTPRFTKAGFIKPDQVALIENGVYKNTLNSARSAKEYGEIVNSNSEQPQSLYIDSGNLEQRDVMSALDTGIYVSNLWYCNYSDRSHCRITGMTRFASMWVENGEPVAPINVMRFDETLYHMLGDNLIDLTQEREHIFDSSTYESRSEASALLPGALIEDFRLTL